MRNLTLAPLFATLREIFLADGLVVATALAVVPALGLIDVSTPVQVENFMKACIANYRPNVKAPRQLNSSNVEVWVNGQISRILGLMNSCPASVAGLYNFGLSPDNFGLSPGQSSSFTAENIVRAIPLPNKPSWEYIIWSFRIILGRGRVKKDSSGITSRTNIQPLVFNESPITVTRNPSRNNSIGITHLEFQMFSLELVSRAGADRVIPGIEIKRELDPSTLVSPEEKPKVRGLDVQELEVFLTSLQLASYRSAYKLGNKSRLISLNQTAASRKALSESQQSQPQAIKPEDEQISLGEFARQTSSSKKRRGRPKSVNFSPSSSRASNPRLSPDRDLDDRGEESTKSTKQSEPSSDSSTMPEGVSEDGSAPVDTVDLVDAASQDGSTSNE